MSVGDGPRFVKECGPGSYESIDYSCCPRTAFSLASDMGPCRGSQLSNANGWTYFGGGCGNAGGCDGYDWAFYPAELPYDERTCMLELSRRGSLPTTAVLSDADCAALKCWLTSDVLFAALDGKECGDGQGMESTAVDVLNGEDHRRKYSGCTGEPFPSHRAIMRSMVEKYLPGP